MKKILCGVCVGAAVLSAVLAAPDTGGGVGVPVVTVQTRKAAAKEGGTGTQRLAGFVLHRTGGNPDQTLAVTVVVGGTAAGGDDYEALPTQVVMPDGGGPVTVVIAALDDEQPEGNETVTLRVVSPPFGGGYTVGSPSQQTVTIQDNDGGGGL